MNVHDGFDRTVSVWLDEQAGHGSPDYLDETLARTTRARQRAWWASLERWLPVQTTFSARMAPTNRLIWTFVVLAMVILAAAVLLLAGVGQRRLPHFGSVANGEIYFVDGGDLKVAAADGSNVRIAAALPSGLDAVRLSPDGALMAYRKTTTPGSLVVAQADGSHPVVVSGDAAVPQGAQVATWGPFGWSPDSRQLAFTETVAGGTRAIDVIDADGSHVRPLISDPAAPALDRFDPQWSPDGKWISFFSSGDAADSIALNVVHPDGSEARRLPTSPINREYLEASWAPDPSQTRLAFMSGDYVKIFDLATSKETDVGTGFWGSWSPDARRIAWWDGYGGPPVGANPKAGGIQVANVADVLAGSKSHVSLFPDVVNLQCYLESAVVGICSPAGWSPDSNWVFGPDPTGGSIVFTTVDEPHIVRTIKLDHPVDLTNGPQGSVAWQPVAP